MSVEYETNYTATLSPPSVPRPSAERPRELGLDEKPRTGQLRKPLDMERRASAHREGGGLSLRDTNASVEQAPAPAGSGGGGDAGGSTGGGARKLSRAVSFERKLGQQRRGDAGGGRLQRSVSFGRKSKGGSGDNVRRGSTGTMQLVSEPAGKLLHEGYLWKRTSFKYQKRWFFLQAATLCYYDASSPGENAIVCGQLSSVVVTSSERLELTMFTDQRQYDFRCECRKDLDAWKAACEKAIGVWMQS